VAVKHGRIPFDAEARTGDTSIGRGESSHYVRSMDVAGIKAYLDEENGLTVCSTTQADGRVLSSVVNCGVIDHPIDGTPRVAFVSTKAAARLVHIRRGSQVTVTIRRGWSWISATGSADLIGSDALPDEIDAERLRLLFREIFQAAGGTHEDYEEFDRTMANEGRVVVLVIPERILGNRH